MAIGDQIREHRLRVGLTQSEVADRSRVSVRALRDIENNRVSAPRPAVLGRLASTLGLSDEETGELLAHGRPAVPEAVTGADRPWIGVLGPLAVRRGGCHVAISSRLQGDLLGLMAVQPGSVVSTDEIIDVLWGERPPQSCLQLVQTYVSHVRAILEPGRRRRVQAGMLRHAPRSGYRLAVEGDDVDLAAFTRLTGQARADDDEAALRCYTQALDLWRGPVLAGAGDRLLRHPAVTAVARQRSVVAMTYADLAMAAGRHDDVVDRLGVVFDGDPLHEGLAARLVRALAASGGQAAALTLFREIRRRLSEDLGIEPGAELQEAHVAVLRGQAAAVPVASNRVTPRQLPVAVRHFVGRIRELTRLNDLADEAITKRRVVIAAVDGLGGIGKTALVTHWAHSAAPRFPDGQLFLNLRGFSHTGSPMTTAEAVRCLLEALDVPPHRTPAGMQAQVGLLRSVLAGRQVLLVLDNARDADHVRELIPGSGAVLVLVTSRRRLTSLVAVQDAEAMPLVVLSDAEARELLRLRMGSAGVVAWPAPVDELVGWCAGLPLAVSIVSACAGRRPVPQQGTLADLGGNDASIDVRTVFSWSYRGLEAGTARLFRLLGLHPGPDIGVAAAASLTAEPAHTTRARLAELVGDSLVEEPARERFTVHDLLRAYAKELAETVDGPVERTEARRRLFDHYLHSAHAGNLLLLEKHLEPISLPSPSSGLTLEQLHDQDDAYRWFARERETLLAVIDEASAAGFDRHAWQLAWSMITYLNRRGHYQGQLRAQHAAAFAARRAGDAAGQAQASRALGGAQTHLGQYPEARENLLNAVREFAAIGDTNGQASAHLGISFLGAVQNDNQYALDHCRAALELYRTAANWAGQANTLNSMGWHHGHLGDTDAAVECCTQAIAIQQQIGNRIAEGATQDTLGVILQSDGRHEQALACFHRSYRLVAEFDDTYLMASVLEHAGDSQLALGDRRAARSSWQRALETIDGTGHPDADRLRKKLNEHRWVLT